MSEISRNFSEMLIELALFRFMYEIVKIRKTVLLKNKQQELKVSQVSILIYFLYNLIYANDKNDRDDVILKKCKNYKKLT